MILRLLESNLSRAIMYRSNELLRLQNCRKTWSKAMYTRVFLAESVWRVWKTQCNIFIWNFSILRLAHRLGTTHDSRKWMSHRVSVFLCSEGDGVTHSTSRDFQNSHVTGELWPSLSGIFQFLILSLLRMPGGAVRIRRSLDKRTRDKMARPLYFFHRKIRLYINFLDSYIIHEMH